MNTKKLLALAICFAVEFQFVFIAVVGQPKLLIGLEQFLIGNIPPSAQEMEDMAKEYEAFGVTYDIKNDQWYFNGEKVRFFRDVLTSNGGMTATLFQFVD